MEKKRKQIRPDGSIEYESVDIRNKLNLNFLQLANKTKASGEFDLPALTCNTDVLPDYIALYGQPGSYHKTPLTAVGFWQFDDVFDGIHGLYNAIYHNEKKLLEKYRKRFEGVKIFFTPDYSQFGDIDRIEMLYRLKKARIVGLWLAMELSAVVIPFITAPTAEDLPLALNGLEDCHVVAFSTKGYANSETEKQELKRMIRLTVDTLNLKTIVVYDVCKDDKAVRDIFEYAFEQGIRVAVPPNVLKERNEEKARLKRTKPAA